MRMKNKYHTRLILFFEISNFTQILIIIILMGYIFESSAESKLDSHELVTFDLLGNSEYPAICYSGHRGDTRSVEATPTVEQTKSDLRILAAMGFKWIRTYNTTLYPHTERILKAIDELKKESDFEMYVMVGAWITCNNPESLEVDHAKEDILQNTAEINGAIELASRYPDIVRIIAVGNEAMVHWQPHHVSPDIILKWVEFLDDKRTKGILSKHTLITCSDNWAAFGGEEIYRSESLNNLLDNLDFISLHTYAFHDTYYNKNLKWDPLSSEKLFSVEEQIHSSVKRAINEQKTQLSKVSDYILSLGLNKQIHIGETGWATLDNSYYGENGTRAAHEFTAKVFYDELRLWIKNKSMTCFYFEAFDEPWKSNGTSGSEGHFGLFTVNGEAKYAIWDLFDSGVFNGLDRDGNRIKKTHSGDIRKLKMNMFIPRYLKFSP